MSTRVFTHEELQAEAEHLQRMLTHTKRFTVKGFDAVGVCAEAAQNKHDLVDLLGGWRRVVKVETTVRTETKWKDHKAENSVLEPTVRWIEGEGKVGEVADLMAYVTGYGTEFRVGSGYYRSLEETAELMRQIEMTARVEQGYVPRDAIPNLRAGQRLLPVVLRVLELKLKWVEEAVVAGWVSRLDGDYYTDRILQTKAAFERFAAALGAEKERKVEAWVLVSAAPSTPLVFGTKGFDGKACFSSTSVHSDFKCAPGTIGVSEGMVSMLAFSEDITGKEREAEMGQFDKSLLGRGWGEMMEGQCAVHNIYGGQRDVAVKVLRQAAAEVAGFKEGEGAHCQSVSDWVRFEGRHSLYLNNNDGPTSVGDTSAALMSRVRLSESWKLKMSPTFLAAVDQSRESEDEDDESTFTCEDCRETFNNQNRWCCYQCENDFCAACWSERRREFACGCRVHDVDDTVCGSCTGACYDCDAHICDSAPQGSEDGAGRCIDCHTAYEEALAEAEAEAQAQADADAEIDDESQYDDTEESAA